MAPLPNMELIEWSTGTPAVLGMLASMLGIGLIVLAMIGCAACCGGKDQKAEGGGGEEGKGEEPKVSESVIKRKAPPKVGVGGADRQYRTMMDVDKDFAPSDKKEPAGGGKGKKDFASGRDPAYRSLMGLDDKFEPSGRNK